MMDDIIQEILLRLPPKSIARCTYLSKKVHAFISHNQSFRQTYISRNRGCLFMMGFFSSKRTGFLGEEPVRFLATSSQGRSLSVLKKRKRYDAGDEATSLTDVAFPLDEPLRFVDHHIVHVVGSSNGILLATLERNRSMTYMILNPINKQCVPLSKPNICCQLLTHGFTCDTTLMHYKVVRGICPKPNYFFNDLTLEIFSSDLPEWKRFNIISPFPFFLNLMLCFQTIISEEGVIYLPGFAKKGATSVECLLIFNHCKEISQLMEFPPKKQHHGKYGFFGMSNGLMLYARHELGELKVWVLNEEDVGRREWSSRHKVNLDFGMEKYPYLKNSLHGFVDLIAFHPMNPQVIFLAFDNKKFLYDMDHSKLELIWDFGQRGWQLGYNLFPYTYALKGPHLFCDH